MEPLSIIAIGAAVGGAAGKFVEKAWDSGEKWLQNYLKDHKEKAKENAEINSKDFLKELADKIKILEETKAVSKDKIENAQDHPDFSILLQKALLTSAQSDSKEKHILLARLVSERLASEPETTFSLASKMAVDAIAYTNINQLKILGIMINLMYVRPLPWPPQGMTKDIFQDFMTNWINVSFKPYDNLIVKPMDLNHLESLSCIRYEMIISRQIKEIFSVNKSEDFKFDFDKFKSVSSIGVKIEKIWNEGQLQRISLTSTGQLIGIFTSDLLSATKTDISNWDS